MRCRRLRTNALLVATAIAVLTMLAGCSGGADFTSARFVRSVPIGGADPVPLDVIIDLNGSLYVMDAGSWQVSKYTGTGVFLENLIPFFAVTAGTFGPNQDIFVVSPGEGSVKAFSLAGVEKHELEITLPSGTRVYGVAVNAAGQAYLWAVDELVTPPAWSILRCTGSVCQVFAAGGTTAAIPVGQQQRGVAVDLQGYVYYADPSAGRIRVIDPLTMQGHSIGSPGSAPGQLNDPRDVAVDSSGNVYVADTGNHRIQKFSPEGVFLFGFGGPGTTIGLFQSPQGVAVDRSGAIVVADTGNDRLQVFSQF